MARPSDPIRWMVVSVAAASLLCGALSAAESAGVAAPKGPASADPRRDMIAALAAPGPHPSLGDEARVFDRLVGTWDCDYSFIAEDGTVSHKPGELLFGWIIDGRALQDIWIGYPERSNGERTIGTSVRFFDSKSRLWRVVFVAPAFGVLTLVQGGAEGDRIVLRGQDGDGSSLRWSFNEIESDSFVWRGEKSRDGGKTWRLEEEHHMKRRTSASAQGASPETLQWFLTTEQALMDALAPGDKAIWDRIMDPSCVVTTEEGQVVTKDQFLEELRPLPQGLSGSIVIKDLTVQEFPAFTLVRYRADESESVFGQHLAVQYRVTNAYRREAPAWKMVASHLSVVTRDPPAQDVSKAGWPGLVGQYRLLTNGWTFTVELRDGELYGGRDPKKLRRLIPLTPDAFVLSGSLGEWLFVVENGQGARIVNLRKFAVLVWNRVAAGMPPAPTDRAAANGSRGEMIAALAAWGPHPSLGDQAHLFDRFVGTWDSDYDTYAADGSVTHGSGELLFGWVIDGRAMQDIWIGHPGSGTADERFVGTSLRFFDIKAAVWRVVWVAPTVGNVITLQGGAVGDRIVLEGLGSDGSSLRWSFNDIRPDAFVWRGERSRDGGRTWVVTQEQRMRRRLKERHPHRPGL